MADTAVAITSGTGTNIDTRTEATNGNHRQVVVLGDPSTNSGVAPVDATAGLKVDLGADNDVTLGAALPAGTNNIGDVDVLTLPALPAGNNNIGDVDVASIAAGDNNIGNVDIVTVPTDPFGANADAASATGSISAKLRFIANTGIPVTGTVTVGSHAVTNAGTFAVQVDGAALTSLQLLDDVVATLGTTTYTEAATKGNVIGAVRRDANTTLVNTTNEIAPLQVNATGELKVAQIQPLPAGTNAIGKLASNAGVTIGAVEIAATQTLSTVTTVGTVTTLTGGGIAHDSADSGNPVKVGAKAIAALSGATLVAAADRADNQADLDGALIVRNNFALGDLVNGNASNTDGASTQVLAAGAAGVKHYITDVTITNTSASNIYVELKDNTTVKWTFPVPANSGVTHHFASPLGGTAATAWNFDPSAAATTIYCSVSGFKSKI